MAWAVPATHSAPATAIVRISNHSSATATVAASADRYRGWLARHLRLMVPHHVPLQEQSLVAVAPGDTADLAVPVTDTRRRTVIEVSATALGQRAERTSWLLEPPSEAIG